MTTVGGKLSAPGEVETLNGGPGVDTAIVDASALTTATFSGGPSSDELYDSTNGTTIYLNSIEALDFTGNATGGPVSGGTGDDILIGLDGNDSFVGGLGNNTINGGGGTNTGSLDFSDRTGKVVLVNGGAADTVYKATVDGVAAGSVENIQSLSIIGGSGDDTIGGAYTAPGATATLDGGSGGTDTAVVDASSLTTAAFIGGPASGELYDNTNSTTIHLNSIEALDFTGNADASSAFGNGVAGGTGNDVLTGLDGNDTFTGNGGNDTIDGGGGFNGASLNYSDRTGDLALLNGGVKDTTYTATVGGVAAGSVRNIQALSVTGGSGNDTIGGAYTSYGAVSTLDGGGGTNTLVVDASSLTNAHFSGGLGPGELYDSSYSTTINLANFAGLDFTGNADASSAFGNGVAGGTGNDVLTGLDGNDTFTGNGGNDTIDGGGGFNGASLNYSDRTSDLALLNGGVKDTTYTATVGGVAAGSVRNIQALSVTGGSGNDTIGGAYTSYGAVSTLDGGGGTNTLVVDASSLTNAHFSGGLGPGELYDSSYSTTINLANFAGLDFTGNADASSAFGNGVAGGTGNDVLTGLDGNDTFTGNGGNDTIDGGGGFNTAIFAGNFADYSVTSAAGVITVKDLRPGSPSGIDILKNIQVLEFDDQTVGGDAVPPSYSAPSTNPDTYTALLDGTFTVPVGTGVLANDSDPTGVPLTATVGTGPKHGTLALNPYGSFSYTPTVGYVGADSFTYTASDGPYAAGPVIVGLDVVPATITIDVPPALAPGETGTATIHYTASATAPANMLLVEVAGAQVADPLTGGFSNSALVFVPGDIATGHADIPVTVKMASIPTTFSPTISVAVADPTATIDWAAQKAVLKPASITDAAWDRIYANFTAAVGTTVGSLTTALGADAAVLASFGINAQSGSAAIAFELEQAGDFGSLAARGATGSLGQGWSTVADLGLSIEGDGTVTLQGASDLAGLFTLDAADAGRYSVSDSVGRSLTLNGVIVDSAAPELPTFTLQTNGTYLSSSGAALVKTANGFTLTEADGSTLHFDKAGHLQDGTSASGVNVALAYDASGRATTLVGSNGSYLELIRNAAGGITSLLDSTGGSLALNYDTAGKTLVSTTGVSGTTGFTYAASGDLTKVSGAGTAPSTTFSYDTQGRLTGLDTGSGAQTEAVSYDDVGGYTITDGSGTKATVALLPDGTVGRVTDANGNASSLLFNSQGQVTGSQDANGGKQTFAYDSVGRVTAITDADGATVSFGYTGTGTQPTSFTDAIGSTRSFTYDAAGHITGATWPDGTTLAFDYDAAGNLTSFTNRNGQTTTYSYDAAGNETTASDSPAGSTTYTYDGLGRLVTATTAEGQTSLAYDGGGRVSKITYPDGRSLAYAYDAAGRRVSMTDQDGHAQLYSYDAAGRLATLGTENGTLVTYSYDAAGNLLKQSNANGTATTYAYDAAGRLTAIDNKAPDASTSSFEHYSYDAASLRTSMTTQDGSWTYGYDANGQLITADFTSTKTGLADKSLSYTYDLAGNRVRSTEDGVIVSYTTNALNQYTKVGDNTFTYDSSGNMISRSDTNGTTRYQYDSENRLSQVTNSDGTVSEYRYDVFGNRTGETIDGISTIFLNDPFGLGNSISSYSGSGDLLGIDLQGLGIAAEISLDKTETYIESDAVGSITGTTDISGLQTRSYAYTPFGQTLYAVSSSDQTHLFNGAEGVVQNADGTFDMRSRGYASDLGRFLSEDPLVLNGDVINLQRFALNNPVSNIDPSGLISTNSNSGDATHDFISSVNHRFDDANDAQNYENGGDAVLRAASVDNTEARQAVAASKDVLSFYQILYSPGSAKEKIDEIGKLIYSLLPDKSKIEGAFDELFGIPKAEAEEILPSKAGPYLSLPSDSVGGQTAGGFGCPHFNTYDGLNFDFQGAGEFIAAKSIVPGDTFQVQMRIEPEGSLDSSVSIITQIAVQVGKDRVTFGVPQYNDVPRDQVVWVDGKPVTIDAVHPVFTLDGGTVTAISANEYRVALNTGEVVTIDPFGDGMGLTIGLGADAAAGSVQGFLGADEGQAKDFQLPDGTVLKQPLTQDQLYHAFADAWRVKDGNSLLDYASGQTTATFTDTMYPREILTLADFPADLVAKAAALVASAGITDPTLAADAEFDYITMGNPSFILEDAIAASHNPGTTTPAVITNPTPPPPSLGVLPAVPVKTEAGGDTTAVTFEVNLTSAAPADTVVDYMVKPDVDYVKNTAGKIFFTAADFGATLPSGTVTVKAGQTKADVTIDLPNSALGSAPEKWLGISITSAGSNPIYSPTAQAEIVNRSPVPGTLAAPVLKLLTDPSTILSQYGATLTQDGSTYMLDLGHVVTNAALPVLQFAVANTATPGSDAFVGSITGFTGTGFDVTGTQPSTPILAGSSYSGLYVQPKSAGIGAYSETITFAEADTNDTGYYAELPNITLIIKDTTFTPAKAVVDTSPISFANVRVGTAESQTLTVGNAAGSPQANLIATLTAGPGTTASGTIHDLAPGATDSTDLQVGLATDTAGAKSGTVTLNVFSDLGNGVTVPALPSPTIAVSGNVYREAAGTVALAQSIVHVGDVGTAKLVVANSDLADGFSEGLRASAVSTSGAFTAATGATGLIAADSIDATSLGISFPTATAGTLTGNVGLDLFSDGTGTSGLAPLDLGISATPLSISVNNYAQASIQDLNGVGTFSQSGNAYKLDLGTLQLGASAPTINLAVLNGASGSADLLSGSFKIAGDNAFTNRGFDAFTALVAGEAADSAPIVTLLTDKSGTFSETITLAAMGSNASGYSGALAPETLTIMGSVQGATKITFVQSVTPSRSTGDLGPGSTVAFTVAFSEAVSLSGVSASTTPFLTLSNGAEAIYTGGSGTDTLTFSYTVGATGSDQDAQALAVTGFDANGSTIAAVTITDTVDLSGLASASGPEIDTTAPVVTIDAGGKLFQPIVALAGTGEAGSVVSVLDGTTALGTATVDDAGHWSKSVTLTQDGLQSILVQDQDAAGNLGSASTTYNLPPAVVTATVLPAGRLKTTTYRDGQLTELSYTGIQGRSYDATDTLYGSNGQPASETFTKAGVVVQTETWNPDGTVHDVHVYGVMNQPYTEYDTLYANGKPASSSYSNGQMGTWTYDASGTLTELAYTGIQGRSYDATDTLYGSNGQPASETFTKAGVVVQTETWNPDGTVHDVHVYGVMNQPYTEYDTLYANGKPASSSYSNGQMGTWTYDASGTLTELAYTGIQGRSYDATDTLYGSNGQPASEAFTKAGVVVQTETWNPNGTVHDVHVYGVMNQPYTEYDTLYANGKPASSSYSNGQMGTWTYDASGTLTELAYTGIQGRSYDATDTLYGSNGQPASEAFTKAGVVVQTETWNPNGTVHDVHVYGVMNQPYTEYDTLYANGKPASSSYSNGQMGTWTYDASGTLTELAYTGIQGRSYDATDTLYGSNGQPASETFTKAGVVVQTETWNPNGTVHDVHVYGVMNQPYTEYDTLYANGKPASSSYSNGQMGTWTYDASGTLTELAYTGIQGRSYDATDTLYGSNGQPASETFTKAGVVVQTETWNPNGTVHDVHVYGVMNQPYTEYDTLYANGKPASSSYSNGQMGTWTYDASGTLTELAYTGIQGRSYDATDTLYGSNGQPASETFTKAGVVVQTETWNPNGTVHDVHVYGVMNQPYTEYDTLYANGKPASSSYSNGQMGTWTYDASGTLTELAYTGIQGRSYDATDTLYGSNGQPASEAFTKAGVVVQTETWNPNGTVHDIFGFNVKPGQLVSNGSLIEKNDQAASTWTIKPALANTGVLKVESGTLVLAGGATNSGLIDVGATSTLQVGANLSGTGSMDIHGAASLVELGGASSNTFVFTDVSAATLRLDHSSGFTGQIHGFVPSSILDLADVISGLASLSYTQGQDSGMLSVNDGSHQAQIAFAGAHALSDFVKSADASGGTFIKLHA